MPDAGPSAPSKSKATSKVSKAGGAADEGKKRFEVKKWNAVALWAWDIVVDNCAICRNHIMDLCGSHNHLHTSVFLTRHQASSVKQINNPPQAKSARLAKSARWTTEIGNSRSTDDDRSLDSRERNKASTTHQGKARKQLLEPMTAWQGKMFREK
ncbi:MAG: hypothetical protein Q9181_002904 [Wetmoreana brouardii]